MAVTIRAHYDGRAIVPDEPLDLPVDQPIQVQYTMVPGQDTRPDEHRKEAALRRILARAVHGLRIPDESLRRESIYEDRP